MNQSPWQPGRPVVRQVWMWPPPGAAIRNWPTESREVRIGDAERDRAVTALGDHYAEGRLTREEFDERIEQAMQARFDRDLRPLFADLPVSADSEPQPHVTRGWRMGVGMAVPLLFWLLPMLLVAMVIAAVALSAPWLVWGLLWIFMISRFWARRSCGRRYYR
jgi:Flp pilus assembly protein TadB